MDRFLVVTRDPDLATALEPVARALEARLRIAADLSEVRELHADALRVALVDARLGREAADRLARHFRDAGTPAVRLIEGDDAARDGCLSRTVSRHTLSDLRRLLEDQRPATEEARAAATRDPRATFVGDSLPARRLLGTVRQVAPTDSTVLLQGESGTGKEVLARMLHVLSERHDGPYVAVNCAALPESLIESALFGHEKGAFTGASQQARGAFERADGGTLVLDEISEMAFPLQAKLLRALQEREFERVGGQKPISVDVRVVATTNRDLAAAVDAGEFREDLYYRISVIPVLIPPLRDRREDIPALIEHFLAQAAEATGRTVDGVAPDALTLLLGHDWPGNVRELAHVIERAVALGDGEKLLLRDFLPEERSIAPWRRGQEEEGRKGVVTLHSYDVRDAEARLIEAALEATDGNRTAASKLLGLSPRTLRNKLNRPDDD